MKTFSSFEPPVAILLAGLLLPVLAQTQLLGATDTWTRDADSDNVSTNWSNAGN